MAQSIKRKDGRKYKVDKYGINSLRRKYQVVMDSTMDSENISFSGVPAIGSKHSTYKYLYVASYDIEEGEDAAKKTLTVYVNYERDESAINVDDNENKVEQWGWDSSTDQKDLVKDYDGKSVVNSAGDPFDSVPQVSVYTPVFTKVIKCSSRQNNGMKCNCTVNDTEITIGSMKCPKGTLLCSVEEQRIFDSDIWNYRYTVRLKYKTNKVALGDSEELTEIGWDVGVVDKGMRELKDGKKVMITSFNWETNAPCTATTPELLNGSGEAVSRSASQGNVGSPPPKQYILRFAAYERASFPNWFYSEP